MSLSRTLSLTACMAALALGACATGVDPAAADRPIARTPTAQYPLTVDEQPTELLLAPHDFGLSPAQRAAISDYGRQWSANSTTEVLIEAAAGGGPDAYSTSQAAADLLSAQGVPVRVVGYNAGIGAPVRLSFLNAEAHVYDCNRSWDRLTATHANQPALNYGCALSANRAAMIADPADIVRPRAEDPVDASRRQVVTEKYRRGEITTSTKDDQGSISSSRSVN